MKLVHHWKNLALLLLSLTLFACSSDNPNAEEAHPSAWSNPAGLGTDNFHGTVVSQQGVRDCQACHGLELNGAAGIPGCRECHFDEFGSRIPPGVNWSHGSSHTDLDAYEAVCNACHALSRSFGVGPGQCHDCHGTTTAHVTGQAWLDSASADFHGDSTLNCSSCHDTNVFCATCHFGPSGSRVPAGVSWTHGSVPHSSLAANEAVCNQCHTLTRQYRNQPATCHDCHGTVTAHVTGQAWLDSASADFHGDSTLNCSSCHDTNVFCSTCHFGPSGSRVPAGVSWTHGSVPHASLAANEAVCNQCHTLTRQYRNQPATCHDCHGTEMHALGQPWMDKAAAGWHGETANQGTDGCQACHGSDLRGGSSGVSCFSCHFSATGSRVPPGTSWNHGQSGHRSYGSFQGICTACHNTNRAYNHPPSSCHNCH